jgi:hypothetical protein
LFSCDLDAFGLFVRLRGYFYYNSELIANAKLDLAAAAGQVVGHDRVAVIEAQGADGEVEAKPHAGVGFEVAEINRIGIALDLADVEEDREPDPFDDGNGVFDGAVDVGVATNRLAINIAWADIAIAETAQRIGATEE